MKIDFEKIRNALHPRISLLECPQIEMKQCPPSKPARRAKAAPSPYDAASQAIAAPYLYRQGANAAGCPDAQMQSPFPHRTLRQLHTRTQPQGRKAKSPDWSISKCSRRSGDTSIATSIVPESSSQQRVDAFDWVRLGEVIFAGGMEQVGSKTASYVPYRVRNSTPAYFPREFCFAAFSPVARRSAPVCHPPTLCFARRVEDFRQPKVGKPVNQSTSNIN